MTTQWHAPFCSAYVYMRWINQRPEPDPASSRLDDARVLVALQHVYDAGMLSKGVVDHIDATVRRAHLGHTHIATRDGRTWGPVTPTLDLFSQGDVISILKLATDDELFPTKEAPCSDSTSPPTSTPPTARR